MEYLAFAESLRRAGLSAAAETLVGKVKTTPELVIHIQNRVLQRSVVKSSNLTLKSVHQSAF